DDRERARSGRASGTCGSPSWARPSYSDGRVRDEVELRAFREPSPGRIVLRQDRRGQTRQEPLILPRVEIGNARQQGPYQGPEGAELGTGPHPGRNQLGLGEVAPRDRVEVFRGATGDLLHVPGGGADRERAAGDLAHVVTHARQLERRRPER